MTLHARPRAWHTLEVIVLLFNSLQSSVAAPLVTPAILKPVPALRLVMDKLRMSEGADGAGD